MIDEILHHEPSVVKRNINLYNIINGTNYSLYDLNIHINESQVFHYNRLIVPHATIVSNKQACLNHIKNVFENATTLVDHDTTYYYKDITYELYATYSHSSILNHLKIGSGLYDFINMYYTTLELIPLCRQELKPFIQYDTSFTLVKKLLVDEEYHIRQIIKNTISKK